VRVLVVGGCGFIGSHVVDRLVAKGHTVRVLDQRCERYRAPIAGVDYSVGSFMNRMTLIEALTEIEVVFHLASTTVPGTADLDPIADVKDNLIGTVGMIETMLDMDIRRILFLSSGGTVYGPLLGGDPIAEDHPLLPVNSYGIVKVAIERYLDMFARTRRLTPIVIRASNPYGPRQAHVGVQGVVSTFLQRLKRGEPVEIWGDGTVVRDFFYVEDLANLCIAAGCSEQTGVFNGGSGKGTSLNELVEIISRVTGYAVTPTYRPGRAVDVQRSVLDVTRAKNAFGWQAQVSLEVGISETWRWLHNAARANSSDM
jgi:UDP-glucose 4-epimerase